MKIYDLLVNILIIGIGYFISVLKKFYIRYSENLYIKQLQEAGFNVRIQYPASITKNVKIGDNVYIGSDSKLWASDSMICIKSNVIVGPNLTIMAGDHNFKQIGDYIINVKQKKENDDKDVIICEDTWIGCNVTILKGVTIGKGSIVGAGSIVVKNVLPYTIVAGNPARYLKDRFSKDEILEHEKLLCSKNFIY
jgi:acetyltransferase-like isoleucine patch superfamily enzyme